MECTVFAKPTRPGVFCSMFCDCKTSGVFEWYVLFLQNQPGPVWVLVRETWPAADRNCNPARCVESLTCIRSIEGTASSPGPMDHNCNPARCACSLRGCCGKTHRSGSQLQPGPALGIAYLHSIHRGNCIESRPHGSQLQPGPVCVLVRETWPAADHNRNPARCASLDESTHGSNAIEYRPAADPQLQPGPVCVAR